MFAVIGIVVVFGAVIAGYLMEHGNMKVLLQPAELVIIGGAAIGTVLIGNPLHMIRNTKNLLHDDDAALGLALRLRHVRIELMPIRCFKSHHLPHLPSTKKTLRELRCYPGGAGRHSPCRRFGA